MTAHKPGGSAVEISVSAPISSAQIKALNSSPVQIVAAPGSGKMIAPTYAAVVFYAGGTPYTGGGELRVGPTGMNASQCLRLGGSDGMIHGDAGGDGFNSDAGGVGFGSLAEFDNSPLFFGCGSADFANGDGTLVLTVLYTILDI